MRRAFALFVLATVFVAGPVLADQLTGMGANIHGNYFSFPKANLDKTPVGKIKVGALSVGLASTKLKDLAKAFGGTIRSGGGATWVCYHTEDANSWFISNAQGGQEFVMMVAMQSASGNAPADCDDANAKFRLPDLGVPGLGAKGADLKATFGFASGSKVAYRADRAGGYSDIAQYLGYVLKGGAVTGVAVGETTIPTAH
ncbi:MAG TPA: hypothetical protein VG757_02640 [Devosia sp.]|nr:hypothetical protein [Devosia sp.]